jgi:chromosome segregation ATPase
VKQLEATIAQGGGNGTISGRSVYSSTKMTRGGGEDVDSKAEEGLQEMSRERRQVVEQLTEERIQLQEQNAALEKKSTAQKARISILENEIRKLKDSLQIAVEKSQNDDELLEVLKKEIGKLQSKLSRTQDDLANATSMQSSLRKQLTLTLKGERLPPGCESPTKTRDDSGMNEWEMKEQELKRLQRLCKHQVSVY